MDIGAVLTSLMMIACTVGRNIKMADFMLQEARGIPIQRPRQEQTLMTPEIKQKQHVVEQLLVERRKHPFEHPKDQLQLPLDERQMDSQMQEKGSIVQPLANVNKVGDFHVVVNEELRNPMKTYDIATAEIRQMLKKYAQGEEATITKTRHNDIGAQEVITLDLENFITKSRPRSVEISNKASQSPPFSGESTKESMMMSDVRTDVAFCRHRRRRITGMKTKLHFVILLGFMCTVFGQLPSANDVMISQDPLQQETTALTGETESISAGGLQVVYNDELRSIMSEYNITVEDIRRMLEVYAKGGNAEIVRTRINPENGLQEIITLDFEQFTTPKNDGSSSSTVTSTENLLPGQKPDSQANRENLLIKTLADLRGAEAYLRERIKDLDAQLPALNIAYRQGHISLLTRNQNAIENRKERRKTERELRTVLHEIERLIREEMRKNNRNTDNREPASDLDREIQVMQEQNRILAEILRSIPDTPKLPIDNQSGSGSSTIDRSLSTSGDVAGTDPSYEALRQEVLRKRARELYLLRQLRLLSGRFSSLSGRRGFPVTRNTLLRRQPIRRQINFNRTPQRTNRRMLTGSVTGGNMSVDPRIRVISQTTSNYPDFKQLSREETII
ncbi:uncharacterized protein LOC134229704 [Saccostrea cucullata]|uniref:uncharacterized protein LOC134229704 n=1 Tax=Saccostrea cuccullata TaxID=36930 RepID=UPI002ED13E15